MYYVYEYVSGKYLATFKVESDMLLFVNEIVKIHPTCYSYSTEEDGNGNTFVWLK